MKFEDIKVGMKVADKSHPDVMLVVNQKTEWLDGSGQLRKSVATRNEIFLGDQINDLIEYNEPEPEYFPWTIDDFEEFKGLWFKKKKESSLLRIGITSADGSGVYSLADFYSYEYLLENFEIFPSGKPCGKLKE